MMSVDTDKLLDILILIITWKHDVLFHYNLLYCIATYRTDLELIKAILIKYSI